MENRLLEKLQEAQPIVKMKRIPLIAPSPPTTLLTSLTYAKTHCGDITVPEPAATSVLKQGKGLLERQQEYHSRTRLRSE